MTSRTFWAAGVPATKGSWKVTRFGKLRPDNKREQPWADVVYWRAKESGCRVLYGAVRVMVSFYFPKPKKPTHDFPSRNDVDKLARSCLDALTHMCWVDDQQVVDLRVTKCWADVRGPGASITIEEVA